MSDRLLDRPFNCIPLVRISSQMIAMCREVWKSSPNVISHIEKADKHLLEDKRRWEKIEQLKVNEPSY